MRRIGEYKKLFGIEGVIDLKELKTIYRNLIKEWHPDKIRDEALIEIADVKSKEIIDGYHFLISIAPETKEAQLEAYMETIAESKIEDYRHKSMTMELTFSNGDSYEYFGVNQKFFNKFHKAANQNNFARRNLYHSFLYRKAKKATKDE
jgi:DnaJ-class molecular chaperone